MSGNVEFEPINRANPEQRVQQPVQPVKEANHVANPQEDSAEMAEIKARIRQRKMDAIRKKNRARNRRKALLCIIMFAAIVLILSFTNLFTVDLIDVRGNSYFTADEIINMGHATPGKNLIYHPDKKNIVGYLEKNPYIKKAKVSRHFPSTLVITVEERTPVCAIRYDKDYLIIDDEGILIRRTNTTPKLTLVDGVVVRRLNLGEQLGVKDKELLDQTLAILNKAKEKDLYYVKLDMTNMYILAYIYDSLVCKGTYKQLITTMDNDRLHRVLEKLFEDNIKRGTITFSSEGYVSYLPTV